MIRTLQERVASLRLFKSLWESVLLSLLFITLLYFLSSDIEIRLESYHDIILLFLALITLYNGTLHGLVSLAVIAFSIYFFTLEYQRDTILEYMVFVLLFGEFHFHYTQRGIRDHEEKNYLKAKFRELSNAFFALKVSHDQLEKGYLLKPVTLRSLILKLSQEDTGSAHLYQTLFETFSESFALSSALYCSVDEQNRPVECFPLGESTLKFDPNHPMIAETIKTQKAHYLSEEPQQMQQENPLLAVLPVLDTRDRLQALFLIEKMDFLEFNMDNLLKIQILLEYVVQHQLFRQRKEEAIGHLPLPDLDHRFLFEVDRLYQMYRRFKVHSSLVVIYTESPAVTLTLENFKTKKMRLLDMVAHHQHGKNHFYLFLLPLERISGAISFKQRLEGELSLLKGEPYQTLLLPIEKIDTLSQWITRYEA